MTFVLELICSEGWDKQAAGRCHSIGEGRPRFTMRTGDLGDASYLAAHLEDLARKAGWVEVQPIPGGPRSHRCPFCAPLGPNDEIPF